MKQLLLVFLLFTVVFSAAAQDSLKTYFYIFPKGGGFLRVDNTQLIALDEYDNPLYQKMTAGKHKIEIWIPNHLVYTDTIEVKEGQNNVFQFPIRQRTQAWLDYKAKMPAYYGRFTAKVLTEATIVGLNVLHTRRTLRLIEEEESRLDIVYEDLLTAKRNYENAVSTSDISSAISRYNSLSNDYETAGVELPRFKRNRILLHAGTYTVSLAAMYFVYKFDINKPKYPVDKNPFLTSPNQSTTSLFVAPTSIGLTLKF